MTMHFAALHESAHGTNRTSPMSDLGPLSGVEWKLDFGAGRAAFDPTETSS
jgi:hypothetical protein